MGHNYLLNLDKFFSNKTKDEIVDILDKIAKEQVQKILEVGWEDTREYLNAYDQKMVMEREAIASSAFWTAKTVMQCVYGIWKVYECHLINLS